MLRSIHLSPTFSRSTEIDSTRSKYDPLAAQIRPHITLVFPFESSLSKEELTVHTENAVAAIGCFRVTLGPAQTKADYIWLPVVEGRNEVIALHNALYQGPLGLHLDSARTYEPHLTIARLYGSNIENAHRSALALRGPFEAWVDRLIIESIMRDQGSKVEGVVRLKKKSPCR